MQGTAHVEADIVYSQLAIDEGAEFEGAARRSARPLEEHEAPSALADLKRMIQAPEDGKAPCAKDANGHGARTEQPPQAETPVSGRDGRSQEEPGFGARDR